ncbi:MAG: hypothetical protein LBR30_01785, partial [Clostridioides sp.]|nr:hypothetical protein [Clostridioides sp.]
MRRIFLYSGKEFIHKKVLSVIDKIIFNLDDISLDSMSKNIQNTIEKISKSSEKINLYFIVLDEEFDEVGIRLAQKIREQDIFGKIVFITKD